MRYGFSNENLTKSSQIYIGKIITIVSILND